MTEKNKSNEKKISFVERWATKEKNSHVTDTVHAAWQIIFHDLEKMKSITEVHDYIKNVKQKMAKSNG